MSQFEMQLGTNVVNRGSIIKHDGYYYNNFVFDGVNHKNYVQITTFIGLQDYFREVLGNPTLDLLSVRVIFKDLVDNDSFIGAIATQVLRRTAIGDSLTFQFVPATITDDRLVILATNSPVSQTRMSSRTGAPAGELVMFAQPTTNVRGNNTCAINFIGGLNCFLSTQNFSEKPLEDQGVRYSIQNLGVTNNQGSKTAFEIFIV